MTARAELSSAVSELEALFRRSAELATEDRDANRREAVALRRAIAERNGAILALGEQAFEDSERRTAFRSEFSRMRSALALHRASWPIVSIVLTDPAYVTSVQTSREAHRRFVDWVRAALPGTPLSRSGLHRSG